MKYRNESQVSFSGRPDQISHFSLQQRWMSPGMCQLKSADIRPFPPKTDIWGILSPSSGSDGSSFRPTAPQRTAESVSTLHSGGTLWSRPCVKGALMSFYVIEGTLNPPLYCLEGITMNPFYNSKNTFQMLSIIL